MAGIISTIFGKKNNEIPEYGSLLFDHLRSEFLLKRDVEPEDKEICERVEQKRQSGELTWNDIYAYQLILLKYQDFESLKSNIISLRSKYQNLTDAADYGDYLTLRSVDITKISETGETLKKLRADYQFLIKEFCLRYSYLSNREKLRSKLLSYGAILTLFFFIVMAVFIAITFAMPAYQSFSAFSTLIAAVFAGIMGAFVSMQQRLQSLPHGGDPIYSLSLLTHGWLSIFLSPISGAIFAVLLYLFFAGGLLKGTIFPEMKVLPGSGDESSLLALANFFVGTAPIAGKDFALLLVWSFIAGFAERFVPDTLMRLVNQKKPVELPEK
jgi:hypothetical protein